MDKSSTRSSAVEKTFATYELGEHIFSYLVQSQDLFGCLRVCKRWNSLILGSARLQPGLFLAPTPPETAWILRYDPTVPDVSYGSARGSDPHVARSSYETAAIVPATEAERSKVFDTDKICLVARPNPLLLLNNRLSGWQSGDLNLRAANGEARELCILNTDGSPIAPDPQSTMMRMLLTQPPATSVAVTIFVWNIEASPPKRKAMHFEVVDRDRGVRYGDILPLVQRADSAELGLLAGVSLDFEGLVFPSAVDNDEALRQAWMFRERDAAAELNALDPPNI